jgi:hypothetical protein
MGAEMNSGAKAEAMIAIAPSIGIDVRDLAQVHHRLTCHEQERLRTPPSPSRVKLDATIEAELETLCQAFLVLERAADDTGTT